MTADCGVKVRVQVDETLEAVALVLRDLKADFEESLSQVAANENAEREGLFSRLADLAEKIDVAIEADRRERNARLEELHQQTVASADKQREDNEKRAAALEAVLEVLRKKIDETEKAGRGAVDIAQATQESMLRLAEEAEEAKQAMEPLAEGVDDVRARHQTVMAELAEWDAKVLVKEDLDGLRSWVTGLSDPMAEKIATLSTRFEEFQALDRETQNLFQRISAECKSLVVKDDEYREKFTQALEGLASKQDLEAIQELLEESAARITDAVDFSEKAAAETERAFEKHRTRMETALEALRDAVSDQQEQLRGQLTRVRDEIFSDLDKDLRALVEMLAKNSDRMLVQQAERFVTKLSENIRGERGPTGQVSRVQQWVPDYQFQELALVRHRAGLWQANCATAEEPRDSCEDWNLVAAGIRSIAVSPDETPGSYRLLALDSADFVHACGFEIPLPTFHKTWDVKHEYRHYDSVMEDGHRWLATKDAPTGPPSRSEDWALLGMRGGRGARGAKGEPGPAGLAPDMEEILDAYDQRRRDANGTPVSSFRGTWKFGADYIVGDFVRGPGVMALCREAHRAESPPTSTNGRWEILFDLPDPGTEGGPRPQDLQAQITALTAQVQALTGAG